MNNIEIAKPGQQPPSSDPPPIIEESETDLQIEEVIEKVNRQNPTVNTDVQKSQPVAADNEPASGASVHSRNSQKSQRSGKSRASINSKKS